MIPITVLFSKLIDFFVKYTILYYLSSRVSESLTVDGCKLTRCSSGQQTGATAAPLQLLRRAPQQKIARALVSSAPPEQPFALTQQPRQRSATSYMCTGWSKSRPASLQGSRSARHCVLPPSAAVQTSQRRIAAP